MKIANKDSLIDKKSIIILFYNTSMNLKNELKIPLSYQKHSKFKKQIMLIMGVETKSLLLETVED